MHGFSKTKKCISLRTTPFLFLHLSHRHAAVGCLNWIGASIIEFLQWHNCVFIAYFIIFFRIVLINPKSGRSSGQSCQQFCINCRISSGAQSSVISGRYGGSDPDGFPTFSTISEGQHTFYVILKAWKVKYLNKPLEETGSLNLRIKKNICPQVTFRCERVINAVGESSVGHFIQNDSKAVDISFEGIQFKIPSPW